MPRRQELDTWRAGQRRTRTCDVTQECEKLNYSDQLTVINEASVQCQDCQGAGLLLAAVPPAWLSKDPLVIFSHHLLRGSAEAVIWQSSLSTLLCSLYSTMHTVTGPCSSHHTSAASGKWTRRCVVTGQWTLGWHWTACSDLAYWLFQAPNFGIYI